MGNCLKGMGGDGLALLREPRDSMSSPGDALGPPPPYQLTHVSYSLNIPLSSAFENKKLH